MYLDKKVSMSKVTKQINTTDIDKENHLKFQNGFKLNKTKLLEQIKIISQKKQVLDKYFRISKEVDVNLQGLSYD